jgi:N-hydroxyarylamine O-acetyltransferase
MWEEYLNRIGLEIEEVSIDEIFLKELHKKHVLTMPFEDLDIHSKIPISLNIDSIFNKVVRNGRGGFVMN